MLRFTCGRAMVVPMLRGAIALPTLIDYEVYSMAVFKSENFTLSDKIGGNKVAVVGGRSFLSKKGSECYMLDILTPREVTSRFVDKEIWDSVKDFGVGIYECVTDFSGHINNIAFVDNI